MQTKTLSFAEIEAAALKTKTVPVPEWGGAVIIQELSGADRDEFDAFATAKSEAEDFSEIRAKLVALGLVDENGARLCGDHKALLKKSGAVIARLADEIRKLSGIGADAAEQAEKN